jgi:ribokinase
LECLFQPAFPVKAVDTTAAGDTYTGYFIGGLMEGLPLPACMRRASMASSIGVTRPGAAPSIPSRAEVDAALADN